MSSLRFSNLKTKLWVTAFFGIAILLPNSVWAKRLDSVNYGFVQVWNFCPEGTSPINGTIKGGNFKDPVPCSSNLKPFSVAGGYAWYIPAHYTFQFSTADGKKTSDPIKIDVDKMHWFTIILRLDAGGNLTSEVAEDTYSFPSENSGTLVFYNAIPEWNFRVEIPGLRPPSPLPLHQRISVRNLPLDKPVLTIYYRAAPDRPETPIQVPLNFKESRKIAFVPVKEVDGQLSMRLVPLGYNVAEFTAVDDSPTPQESPAPTPSAGQGAGPHSAP